MGEEQTIGMGGVSGEPVVTLILPKSGIVVKARRLSPLCVMMTSERMGELDPRSNPEDSLEYNQLLVSTLREIVIEPAIALAKGEGNLHPNLVPKEDSSYLFKWGMGVIDDKSIDLAQEFRENPRDVPPVRPTGTGLRDAAEQLSCDSKPNGGLPV